MAEALSEIHRGEEFKGGDPYIAFQDCKIRCVEHEFGDSFDGMLRYRRRRFYVFLDTSPTRTPGRQRFTAAHEFGHFSIEHHNEGVRNGTMVHASVTGFVSKQSHEREADTFAAHFLMPTTELLRCCRNAKQYWSAQEIFNVSSTFGTSLVSSARRCVQGLPGDSLLIVWRGQNVHWTIGGGDWERNAGVWRVKSTAELIPESATAQAFSRPPPAGQFTQGTSTLAYWTRMISPASYHDKIVAEYAISRGSYGLLTLLRPVD
ncbi:MAG: ImmA/IrrE family metallo-endopeptidase [Candidatus Thiodiazotropha sp. (ex Lucina aurantia)]|nr:ImmA/IrrE family metallo-endopeptidase [Candidatus Thiodiazotropha taylori]MBV2098748.1 ImmA/IrrE family metallo-endopeptidase [Candidatus Thiodiazotropha sp. (ex Codakia orbicularis)]MBV2103676.1 ImmA/IrrE family metallo-endopeptidase [Candidatus Thiodiazotropha sp. (ex Lucina aurantia)]MBV2118115.1 ImmA/IrrE family metallo-endopeptidase [Candidatus Thiodiazotropha sp. (ex Lucina aurantia)]